ncbi:hypothetical protein FACS189456_6050 [Bacteroidia bacterium]|nr:hypothetical protein FACS189456_6050 [Bacteroidia bacterium]
MISCNDDKESTPLYKDSPYVGTYSVNIKATTTDDMQLADTTVNLTVSAQGDAFAASTNFTIAGFAVSIPDLKLNQLMTIQSPNIGFKIPETSIQIGGADAGKVHGVDLSAEAHGYHGGFSLSDENKPQIEFKVEGTVTPMAEVNIPVTIVVSSKAKEESKPAPATPTDSTKLAPYVGSYKVTVITVDSIPGMFSAGTKLDTTVVLTVSAGGKVTANANIIAPATINLTLGSLLVNPFPSSSKAQVGFKIPSGTIEIPSVDTVDVTGSGSQSFGYDGGFDVSATDVTSISFEIAGTLDMQGTPIPLKISVSGAKQ